MMNGSVCFALQTHCALLDCTQENTPVSTFVTRNKVVVVIRFVFVQYLLLELIGLPKMTTAGSPISSQNLYLISLICYMQLTFSVYFKTFFLEKMVNVILKHAVLYVKILLYYS